MSGAYDLAILTPEAQIFEGKVKSVTAPGALGSFQLLVNHAPLIATLKTGNLVVVGEEGNRKTFLLSGGLLEMSHNRAVILADQAEAL